MSKAKQPSTRATMPATAAMPAQAKLARDHFTDDLSSVTGLAQLIAATMSHPLIPAELYNTILEGLITLDTFTEAETPEYVEAMLRNHFAAKDRRAANV